LDIINAYQELGSYLAAARLCGASDKTVKRALSRRLSGDYEYRPQPLALSNTQVVRELVAEKVQATEGLIRDSSRHSNLRHRRVDRENRSLGRWPIRANHAHDLMELEPRRPRTWKRRRLRPSSNRRFCPSMTYGGPSAARFRNLALEKPPRRQPPSMRLVPINTRRGGDLQ
jgi:hypothetical protein